MALPARHWVADPVGDFAIDLIDRPIGVFRSDGAAQDHAGRFPHPSSDPQALDLGFLSEDVRHCIVHRFHDRNLPTHFCTSGQVGMTGVEPALREELDPMSLYGSLRSEGVSPQFASRTPRNGDRPRGFQVSPHPRKEQPHPFYRKKAFVRRYV